MSVEALNSQAVHFSDAIVSDANVLATKFHNGFSSVIEGVGQAIASIFQGTFSLTGVHAFTDISRNILEATRVVSDAVRGFFEKSGIVSKVIAAVRLFSIVWVPFGMYEAVKSGQRAFKEKFDIEERVEHAFSAIASLGNVFDSASTFGYGLRAVGAISLVVLPVLAGLYVFSAILGIASGIANAMGWASSSEQLGHVDHLLAIAGGKEAYDEATVNGLLTYFEEKQKHFYKRHFSLKKDSVVRERLSKIREELQAGNRELGLKKTQELFAPLKERIQRKVTGNKVSCITQLVALTAMVILAVTPLAPLALTMLTFSGLGETFKAFWMMPGYDDDLMPKEGA